MPRPSSRLLWIAPGSFLAACHSDVLQPLGSVAAQQKDLLLASTWLMLIIIVPVMTLTAVFAWRYRASNRAARYEPDWDHSIFLELVIWAIPLLIVICLGAMTWLGTHLLDPYRAIAKAGRAQQAPLVIEVVALDWKWLFIYPQYRIATVNELVSPVGREVEFHITAESVMNSFYVPTLAGQIYAMPGMQTTLHVIADDAGTAQGFSANYSGAGFSGMHFAYRAAPGAQFDDWVATVRRASENLTRTNYRQLAVPTQNVAVRYFSAVDDELFRAIVDRTP